ncbi:MAG: response regulator [Anaerolineae bacterium]|nr:response regulator [Anaerolineae bacterium]
MVAAADRRLEKTLRRVLDEIGYVVLLAKDGRKVLDLTYAKHPHLLILDDQLPHLDINAVCEKIKSDDEIGFVPIIVLSDAAVDDYDDQYNAEVVLDKPVNMDELLAVMRLLLQIKTRIDRLIRENQSLASTVKALDLLKSDIISSVSHELGTPLVQVKAAVALLAEDVAQNNNREQLSMANMAAQAIARLENAVNNIRQLAQTHNIKPVPMMVSDAVDLAVRYLERSWSSRGAHERIVVDISPDLPLVLADKRAMARLLQLLLDNALKFSPKQSPVNIMAYPDGEDCVWVGVQDFGIGIAKEDHERIFDAFFQVDGSSTRRYGGTGTGLALAMLLAVGINTFIEVESQPHRGSMFSFLLPVASLDDVDG